MKKVLFVTKNYPPQKWGIESYSYDLYTHLSKFTKVYLIANKRGKKFLPFFAFIILIKWLFFAPKSDSIYIWDGSLALFGFLFWKLFHKQVFCTIHGLDITWKNKVYQKYFVPLIWKCDTIIAVSENTKKLCIDAGIVAEKIHVISNGISFDSLPSPQDFSKQEILENFHITNIEDKTILLSVARFVERKWIHDFLENVYSELSQDNFIYIIAGFGKYEEIYREIISRKNLKNVYLIGGINSQERANLCSVSDAFIMPNIAVDGDVEGFGITVIEAGFYNLPVIATKREWLIDAILDWKTGILIEEWTQRNQEWKEVLENKDFMPLKKNNLKEIVIENFSWEKVIQKYLEVIW